MKGIKEAFIDAGEISQRLGIGMTKAYAIIKEYNTELEAKGYFTILRSSKHEEQAYNSCAGVLHSCKDVPHRLVQEAAEKCVETNACKYSYFKKVLSMVQNNHSSSAINGTGKLPSHTNIRGKEAYK